MPERSKKDHKHGRHSGHTGSRWHNFHFSGKLISCSVIFGFLLILVGGILLAIGMDRDEESKSDDYGDLQKKPPLVFVGPVIMGIGGFTVVVGIIMCLVETKVFRRRGGDTNPLINSEGGESSRNNEAINGESDPTGIPSDSKRHRKHHKGKKTRKSGNDKKSHSPKSHSSPEPSPCSSQSSEPIGISVKGSRNFLNASDTFMTPPGSFQDGLQMQGAKRDDVTQTTASLLKSFNSSGTYSTEFQTPSASFIDSPCFSSSQDSTEVSTAQPPLNKPVTHNVKAPENARHEFVTPQNSNADILEPPKMLKEEYSPVVSRHAFLTPKNSEDLLEDSASDEESLEQQMGDYPNLPDTILSKKSPDKAATMSVVADVKSPDKAATMSVVADVHEPSKQHATDMSKASIKPSTNPSKPQEEIEHSDIKVDVLIDAIDDDVKGNAEIAQSDEGNVDQASNLTEKNELKKNSEDSVKAQSTELTSGDNLNTDDILSKEDLDSRIKGNADSLNKDKGDE